MNDITTTYDEKGAALTDHREGTDFPAELSFECVNDFVHDPNRHFEELQYLCLGLVNELERQKNSEQNSKKFKTQSELWQWLISGGKIIPQMGETPRNYVELVDGNPCDSNGKHVENYLFSRGYWLKFYT